jgi:hypothetical protein
LQVTHHLNPKGRTMSESTSTSTRKDHVAAVKALVDGGMSQADAVKKVAEDHGCAVNTVRGAMYRAANPSGSTSKNSPRKPKTPADPVAAARAIFEEALANVDKEIEELKVAADAAVAAHKAAKANAADKRAELKKRIASLS